MWYQWCGKNDSVIKSFVYPTVYPRKYAHGFVVLCFVVVMQSFIMNSHEVFIHIHQGCFAGIGAIVRLPQCQWSKPDGYGKISQCITTTKHSKAKTVCIFLGIYCTATPSDNVSSSTRCKRPSSTTCKQVRLRTKMVNKQIFYTMFTCEKIGHMMLSSVFHFSIIEISCKTRIFRWYHIHIW